MLFWDKKFIVIDFVIDSLLIIFIEDAALEEKDGC